MPFTWREYLDLADNLAWLGDAAPPPDSLSPTAEAYRRTAISRAYYAVFHAARDYLVHTDSESRWQRAPHATVWKHLQDCPRRELKRLGQSGDRLKQRRHRADYERSYKPGGRDMGDGLAGDAHNTINEARRLLALIATIEDS